MWKLSGVFLLVITIGVCWTYDTANAATAEISRYDRDRENRKHRSEAKDIDHVTNERSYDDDYSRHDSDEFQGGKLIGKWTNNGAAFEPKWRDGDSVPLVPFNDAKQTKLGRHDQTVRSNYRESSHGVTKSYARDGSVGRSSSDGSLEDAKPVTDDNSPSKTATKNIYYLENDYDIPYTDKTDNSRNYAIDHSSRSGKIRTVTILTNDSRYNSNENAKLAANDPTNDEKKIESFASSRSRFRDGLQYRPYEYELNDDEYQKPRPRKRRPPENYDPTETRPPTYSISWSTERYVESTPSPDRPKWTIDPTLPTKENPNGVSPFRRNETAIVETRRASDNAELKSLLKMQQIEGLSLSEILQRRNLTLNDLLKGNAEVIDVLRSIDGREDDNADVSFVKPKIFETKKFNFEGSSGTTERPKWRPTQTGVKRLNTGNEVSPTTERESGFPSDDSSPAKPVDDDSSEHLDSAETEDGRRKSNDNESLSAIVRLTSPIILPRFSDSFTEKSVVVTTSSVAKRPVDRRRNDGNVVNTDKTTLFDDDEIMEFSDFTVKKKMGIMKIFEPETTTMRNVNSRFDDNYEDSGSTLSIENILGTTEQTVEVFPPTTRVSNDFDDKINSIVMERINRVNGTNVLGNDFQDRSDESPIAEERSAEEPATTENPRVEPKNYRIDEFSKNERTWNNHKIFSTSSKPYEVVVSEIEPEARAEIFELFSSGSSAERLERLLAARNMSIDELIALRQRGSSKVHLAEVSRSNKNSPSRSVEHRVNGESVESEKIIDRGTTMANIGSRETIDDLSNVEIETTSMEIGKNAFDEDRTNVASLGTDRTSFSWTTENSNVHSVLTERTDSSSTTDVELSKHAQLLELLTAFDSLPFSVRPNLEIGGKAMISSETNEGTAPDDDYSKKIEKSDSPTKLVEVGLVEEIDKDDAIRFADSSTRTNFRTNFSSTLDDRKNLSKVRPSIIASGAILGVTIVVFLAIFIVCRIRQKQKYTYRNTFSRAVFQGPAMTARKLSNSSSLNTIMVNVVATSTTKRPQRHEQPAIDDEFDFKSDIENDSLDANDSWDTIPDFMK